MATVDTSTGTYLKNLVDPEVMGPLVEQKFVPNIVLAPLAVVDYTLQGRAGDEVTLPSFGYIGDAEDVEEGHDIPIKQLTATTKKVKVKKAGLAAQMTDEAILSGSNAPFDQTALQLAIGLGSKVDSDYFDILSKIDGDYLFDMSAGFDADKIPEALALFGEEIEGDKVLLVDPATYAALLKVKSWVPSSDIAANMLIRGSVGMAYGCQVRVTERLKGKNALYIVKPGALALFMKRDILIETDRDILNQSTVVAASAIYAPYLYKPSNAIKIKLAGE